MYDIIQDLRFDEEDRLGVTELQYSKIGEDNFEENLRYFQDRCNNSKGSLADRVSLCILYQDNGQFEEALKIFDIKLSKTIKKYLSRKKYDPKNYK